jgi:hypothetical protein
MDGGDRTESGTEVDDPMDGGDRTESGTEVDDPMDGGDRTESGTEVEGEAGCQSRVVFRQPARSEIVPP